MITFNFWTCLSIPPWWLASSRFWIWSIVTTISLKLCYKSLFCSLVWFIICWVFIRSHFMLWFRYLVEILGFITIFWSITLHSHIRLVIHIVNHFCVWFIELCSWKIDHWCSFCLIVLVLFWLWLWLLLFVEYDWSDLILGTFFLINSLCGFCWTSFENVISFDFVSLETFHVFLLIFCFIFRVYILVLIQS